ncbi:MAG TPA: hypothetical protein PLO14_16045, partial [Accumulibacter sp.]|nr:hypothetical protein [Accumulibacter sp.]
ALVDGRTTTRELELNHRYDDGDHNYGVTVTLTDEAGETVVDQLAVMVNNVAPTADLAGADYVKEGALYHLNLSPVQDAGADSVGRYIVHWGDGSSDTYLASGDVTHTYADGFGDVARTISLDLEDDDGLHAAVASKVVTVKNVAYLGDATGPVSVLNPNVWAPFWSELGVAISHKADYGNVGEGWSAVTLNALASANLSGGDLYSGDLGVSGQNLATSTIRQEIQGAEALRFDLDDSATKVTLNLSKLFADDDANLLQHNEAGRLQALDEFGNTVGELRFVAKSSSGNQEVSLEASSGFRSLVITAGAYNAAGDFVFGAYAGDDGQAVDPYQAAGKLHGSDFLIHNVEFEIPVVGAPLDSGL